MSKKTCRRRQCGKHIMMVLIGGWVAWTDVLYERAIYANINRLASSRSISITSVGGRSICLACCRLRCRPFDRSNCTDNAATVAVAVAVSRPRRRAAALRRHRPAKA